MSRERRGVFQGCWCQRGDGERMLKKRKRRGEEKERRRTSFLPALGLF